MVVTLHAKDFDSKNIRKTKNTKESFKVKIEDYHIKIVLSAVTVKKQLT